MRRQLQSRLVEPSTWYGIIVVASLLTGASIEQSTLGETAEQISQAVAAIAGLLAVITPDRG